MAIGATGRRDQILDAARAVLAEHGYERTTVSQIAQRAEVAQGTFYLYFPSKESLPAALAEVMCRAQGEATDRAAEAGGFDAAVEALVDGTYATAEEFRDVLLIANRGVELCSTFEEWYGLVRHWSERIEAFLVGFQASGEVRDDIDVKTVSLVLRDLLDRSAKAQVVFNHLDYATATTKLIRRALDG
jgi:AcrR family transcriptional regulator